jgi:hypothetical protein
MMAGLQAGLAEAAGSGSARCAGCRERAPVGVVELAAVRRADGAFAVRLCGECLRRVHELIAEERAARMAARRFIAAEAGPESPLRGTGCAALGLPAVEMVLLEETLAGLDVPLRPAKDWGDVAGTRETVFARADLIPGPFPTAEAVLKRTVVVARPGSVEQALPLLRAGARDLLVAPLSRQQVIGALDRMGDGDALAGRDRETGIPSYRPAPRFGLPCHLVTVEPPAGVRGIDAYLLLRRFLRGYDRIGLDSGSLLPVAVYCAEAHLEAVLSRIRYLLGAGYEVGLLATVVEMPSLAEAWIDGLATTDRQRRGLAGPVFPRCNPPPGR